jgi:nitrite reductase/ring-hydroxylating ferredoxin subunit
VIQGVLIRSLRPLSRAPVWPDPESWLCAGVADQIPGPGDLLPATLGEYAIHIRRDPDGELGAAYNVQQHGCASVPVQCAGGRKIACPVRSCTFSLDGEPVRADSPGAREALAPFLGFNPAKHVPVELARWGPFLLVTTATGSPGLLAGHHADLASAAPGVASFGCRGWVSGAVVCGHEEIETRLRVRGDGGRVVRAFQNVVLGTVAGDVVGLVVKPVGLGTAEVLLAVLASAGGERDDTAARAAWHQLFGDLPSPAWAGRRGSP